MSNISLKFSKYEKDKLKRYFSNLDKHKRFKEVSSNEIFSDSIVDYIRLFRKNYHQFCSLQIKNLPLKNNKDKIDTRLCEFILHNIASVLGKPFAYKDHREGKIIFDLIPKEEDKHKELGTGTHLGWHTDDAHDKNNCKFIVLLCLRGDKNAKTFVSRLNEKEIKSSILEELKEEKYIISSDNSYSKKQSIKTPIVSKDKNGATHLHYDPSFTETQDGRSSKALNYLEKYFDKDYQEYCLSSGDLLVINNRISAHARSNFEPNYDQNDRWLKRVIVR